MDNEQLKILELKINDLISLRQLVTQTLVVLIGGVVGLFFLPDSKLKYVVIIIGLLYVFFIGKTLYRTINKINKYLYKRNEGNNANT